jgi:hypothetical protein
VTSNQLTQDETAAGPSRPSSTASAHALGLGIVFVVMAIGGRSLLTNIAVPGAVDHPYKFLQQQNVTALLSTGNDPFGWLQQSFGGYPELQFYPPGPALLGAAFHALPGVSEATAYWMMLVVAWFLPAVAAWGALVMARTRAPVAALGGLLVGLLTFGGSGTYVGVGVGVLSSRFSLSFAILGFGFFLRATEQVAPHRGRWLVALAAAMVAMTLSHIYFVPVAGIVVASFAWRQRRDRDRQVVPAMLAALAGVLIAGYWWAGTILFASMSIPRRPTNADGGYSLFFPVQDHRGYVDWILLLVAGLAVWWHVRPQFSRRPFLLASALGPVLVYQAVVTVTDLGLDIKLLSAARSVDAVMFLLALIAPLGLEASPLVREPRKLVAACVAIGLVWCVLEVPVTLPTRLAVSTQEWAQPEQAVIWKQLAQGDGRVIFTSNELYLSHLLGRSFPESGREPLNGGPDIGTPMQAATVMGPGTTSLDSLTDVANNLMLLGLSWEEMQQDPAKVTQLAERLRAIGATTIVAVSDDDGTTSVPTEVLRAHPDLFVENTGDPSSATRSFAVVGTDPARVVPAGADVTVDHVDDQGDVITATVTATKPSSVLIHELDSPYWSVSLDGATAATRPNDYREIVVDVPAGTRTLRASVQTPRQLQVVRAVVALAGVALLVLALVLVRRARRARPADAPI